MKTRLLFTLCALALVARGASAADRITTTDGKQYVRASDGAFYPAEYVAANGRVRAPSVVAKFASACPCGPSCACVSAPGGVGTCGSYLGGAKSAAPAILPPAVLACPSCANGQCSPAPSRGFFRR